MHPGHCNTDDPRHPRGKLLRCSIIINRPGVLCCNAWHWWLQHMQCAPDLRVAHDVTTQAPTPARTLTSCMDRQRATAFQWETLQIWGAKLLESHWSSTLPPSLRGGSSSSTISRSSRFGRPWKWDFNTYFFAKTILECNCAEIVLRVYVYAIANCKFSHVPVTLG